MSGDDQYAEVPFQLLPYFRILTPVAQHNVVLQLVEHFAQVASGAPATQQYSFSVVERHRLTLAGPRGHVAHVLTSGTLSPSAAAAAGTQGGVDSAVLEASFNAAVGVALVCATKGPSYQDMMSWLIQADDIGAGDNDDVVKPDAQPREGSSSSSSSDRVHASSSKGVSLPTHLRPPAITTSSHSTSHNGQPHDRHDADLTDILSAFKHSPSNVAAQQQAQAVASDGGHLAAALKVPAAVAKRALRNVLEELERRSHERSARPLGIDVDGAGAGDGNGNGPVGDVELDPNDPNCADEDLAPFQLLPFFGLLTDHAQRILMRQLVDHFQQTTFTPRNAGALLTTPRFTDLAVVGALEADDDAWDDVNGANGVGGRGGSSNHGGGTHGNDAFSYSISGGLLTLNSPRNSLVDALVVDPNCFEEGFVAAESYAGNSKCDGDGDASGGGGGGGHSHGTRFKRSRASKAHLRETVQAFLDAPVNAAVNVAIKCATHEASFEEVLSWLLAARSAVDDVAHRLSGAEHSTTNSLLSSAYSR
jgi:hypothetical protein